MLSVLKILKPNERLGLSCLIWLGLIILLLDQSQALKKALAGTQSQKEILESQAYKLAQEEDISLRLEDAQHGLDPERTYSTSLLLGKVDELVREQETIESFDISSPITKHGEIFDIHSIRIEIKKADLKTLILFTQSVLDERPYLGMTNFQITPDSRDLTQLTARITIESFEFKDVGLE